MKLELFHALQQWQTEANTRRKVKLEFGNCLRQDSEEIWIYDYDVMNGAYISSLEELETINLKEEKKQRLLRELEHCDG